MTRPTLEVADVIRQYGAASLARYGATLSPEQHRALRAIAVCRTAALGGHITQCDHCGHEEQAYNSCGNRHCPKCPGRAQAAWLAAREAELLDVPYVHVVFTLPHTLSPLAIQNPRVLSNLLFQAVADTLLTVARDPPHLGAEIGFLAVLHTWGQTLHHHPHLHCVVPGGGLSPDGAQWRACRPTFFLPVRVLSRVFRRLFLTGLQQAYTAGALTLDRDRTAARATCVHVSAGPPTIPYSRISRVRF
jgi:Transposase zinc-binding domain/Putative transposase